MLSGFIIAIALVLGGLAVMRFGIFQIRKFKKGETRVTKKVSEQIAFLIFFVKITARIAPYFFARKDISCISEP